MFLYTHISIKHNTRAHESRVKTHWDDIWVTFSAPRYYCEWFVIGNITWIVFKTIKHLDVISANVTNLKGFFLPKCFISYLQFDSMHTFFGRPQWSCSFFYETLPKPDTINAVTVHVFSGISSYSSLFAFFEKNCLRPYLFEIEGKLRFCENPNGRHAHYSFSYASYDNNNCYDGL